MSSNKESMHDEFVGLGHRTWTAAKEWLTNHKIQDGNFPLDFLSELMQQASDSGLNEEDARQAIQEGLLAARIQADPTYDGPKSKDEIKKLSRFDLSPLACVARWLSLVQMIQDGYISAFIDKKTGTDILPELQEALSSK